MLQRNPPGCSILGTGKVTEPDVPNEADEFDEFDEFNEGGIFCEGVKPNLKIIFPGIPTLVSEAIFFTWGVWEFEVAKEFTPLPESKPTYKMTVKW